jgi:uncharacterized pyridoxamine 5'-phosphate oxidase family protein
MEFKKKILLLFFQTIIVSFFAQETTESAAVSLLSDKKEFVAGANVLLKFKVSNSTNFLLYCSNSYGSSVIAPIRVQNLLSFRIPNFLTTKRGTLSWKLLNTQEILAGTITILSIQEPVIIETYLGPPSINAGKVDYTMLVVIPTDSLDNPIRNDSKIVVKHQFLQSEAAAAIYTDKLIGFKNIFSPLKSGRIIISSESFGLNSKEFDVNVMPAIAENFKLFVNRHHAYADGNQITTFYTSVIKDKNKNIVSDGSFIEFVITNKSGNILKTFGSTINGIAKAKIIHPDFEETWEVKGYFIGISESDVLVLNYKKVIENYKVVFSKNNRNLKIGPIKSFMNQIIPDGLSVKLSIFENNRLINEMYKESKNGFTDFYLDPNIFDTGMYRIITKTAGIEKEFKDVKLW